jgi:hypothetical protein
MGGRETAGVERKKIANRCRRSPRSWLLLDRTDPVTDAAIKSCLRIPRCGAATAWPRPLTAQAKIMSACDVKFLHETAGKKLEEMG